MSDTRELAKKFGERVRVLRRRQGLSRTTLADSIGISASALARLERGERFNAANLAPLAEALGVQVRDLFDFPPAVPDATDPALLLRDLPPDQLALIERVIRAILHR